MTPIANHLWQSTFFALAAGVLALALRKNSARVRQRVWLAASCKFLIPFSLLMSLGSHIDRPRQFAAALPTVHAVEQISQPFTVAAEAPSTPAGNSLWPILYSIWFCGFIGISISWWVRWRRIRKAIRSGSPLQTDLPIPAIISPHLMEPGVFGIFRSVLLLPEGLSDRLTPAQWNAVIAHELCHARHRDNLTAAIQMFVETVFWFHPLVWFIGKRMMAERESACDEEVLLHGNEPRAYAEGILSICRVCVQSPLACVSGISGPDLKQRIDAIVANRTSLKLSFGSKVALAAMTAVAVASPLLVGFLHAQTAPAFEAASIKLNTEDRVGLPPRMHQTASGVDYPAVNLYSLIIRAYRIETYQLEFPKGMRNDKWDIVARSPANATLDQIPEMLQTLLAERFHLKVHWETREINGYAMVAIKSGLRLEKADPPGGGLGTGKAPGGGLNVRGNVDLNLLAQVLSDLAGRTVINQTGMEGIFKVDFNYMPDRPGEPAALAPYGDLQSELKVLGIQLDSRKMPARILVVDHIEAAPTEN